MAIVLVQHHVKDYANWKKVFDSLLSLRKSNGELSEQAYRGVSDPNQLTVVTKWDSLANAQKYVQSPDLKAAMENAGVDVPPVISFLNEA